MALRRNFILWLLGPTSSGKTTLAENILCELRKNNSPVIHYDGDEVRDFFGPNLGFTSVARLRVVETLVHLSNKASGAGLTVIVSALTANKDARRFVTENISNLIMCYIECSIETCMKRDPKSLYSKARKGEIDTLIGYNNEYLPPQNPNLTVDTEKYSIDEATDIVVDYLRDQGVLDYD